MKSYLKFLSRNKLYTFIEVVDSSWKGGFLGDEHRVLLDDV